MHPTSPENIHHTPNAPGPPGTPPTSIRSSDAKPHPKRTPGRGIRPWLLIPKILAVGTYLGASITTAMLWWTQVGTQTPQMLTTVPLQERLMTIRHVFVHLALPALVISLIFGILLLSQHLQVFLQMRWLRLKLLLLVIGLPTGHLFMAGRMSLFRHQAMAGTINVALITQINWGFVALVSGSVLILWLGRHKPRLGQNWAKTFERNKLGFSQNKEQP